MRHFGQEARSADDLPTIAFHRADGINDGIDDRLRLTRDTPHVGSGYLLVCVAVNLERDQPIPRARRRGHPSDGARVHAVAAGASPQRPSAMNDVTRILSAIEHGDPQAAEQLLPLVYDELRKLAAQRLAQEKPGQTLQATALVHEAYLRLVERTTPGAGTAAATSSPRPPRPCAASWSRTPAASGREKHGGGPRARRPRRRRPGRSRPAGATSWPSTRPSRGSRPRTRAKAELVKLRYFARPVAWKQAARVLGISRATADRHWAYARAWLARELRRPGPATENPREFLAAVRLTGRVLALSYRRRLPRRGSS